MRKVFLDKLPRENNLINWNESDGYKLPFVYDDISGEIYILRYNEKDNKVLISYDNKSFEVNICSITRCRLGRIFKNINNEFKYKIGENFKDNKRDLIITDKEYKIDKNGRKRKYYEYTCNICSWTEGWIEESHLDRGGGCACCHGLVVVLGINTIWDKARWMCDLGVSEYDAKTHTKCSGEKIEVTCPDCGEKRKVSISKIYSVKSIGCTCGDGYSYPEKFTINILNQLDIKFETQYSPKWANTKKYDFYIPSMNMIVETHGIQHYRETNFKRTLAEEQENDRIKKELALENEIDEYIVIDCRKSELEWIQDSVLNSKLNEIFDLSKIDWFEVDLYAIKNNKIKEVCEYWRLHPELTTTDLAEIFELDKATIISYLKKGSKLNWCVYNPKEEMRKSAKRCNNMKAKQVEMFKNEISLGIFSSCNELDRQSEERFGVKLDYRNISAICNGKGKTYKGFTFKYVS